MTPALLIALSLARPGAPEWTFEEARKCWQPMVRPVEHVGVPGYQFQAGVLWDGALVFGPLGFRELKVMQAEIAPLGDNLLHLSVGFGEPMRFADRKGTGRPEVLRSLEEGRLPIPHVITADGDLRWEEVVFAHLLGRSMAEGMAPGPDDLLVVQAAFTVRNAGRAARTGRLWLHFGTTASVQLGYKCAQKDELAPAIAHRFEAPLGLVGDRVRYVIPPPGKGRVLWHDEAAAPRGTSAPAKSVIEWQVPLAADEEARLRIIIPYGLVDRDAGRTLAGLDTEKLHQEVGAFYRKLEHGAGRIITPDPFINDYLAAVAGQMAQQVAFRARSNLWMYKTSPNHYEGYWPCNAAKALPALDLRGLTSLSRPVLGGFLQMQSDDVRGMEKGAMGQDQKLQGEGFEKRFGFLGNFGEWTANPLLLSHGLGMWALAAHYRITRDDRWLGSGPRSPREAMRSAFSWVAAQRRRTQHETSGKKVEHWGLLPAASAHDWLAGNTIFNDAFCAYGMTEVVRVMRETQDPKAEEMAGELADYRAAIRARYAEARDRARRVPLSDGQSIPYVPRMVQELDWRGIDWTYTGYGPLRAGAWGALEPKDELVDQALAFVEAGMPRGEGAYFSAHRAALAEAAGGRGNADVNWADVSDEGAERHWLWRHAVEYETMWPIGGPLFLARDDLPRFFEWLFNHLAVAIHQDFRVGVESLDGVPSCAPGDGERWQCLRNMLVHERGGEGGSGQSLWLLQAVPRSWLRPGDRISVGEMGTYFGGTLDLTLEVAGDGGSVAVSAEWRHLAVKPRAVVVRLRSGSGRPLQSAEVDGVKAEVLPGDTIELPPSLEARHRITGRFE